MDYGAKSYACFTEGISIYDFRKHNQAAAA
jgi:hypothetical protein